MKEIAQEQDKPWYRRPVDMVRRHAGTAVFVVTAAVLAVGWFRTDLEGARPSLSLAFPPFIGAFCGICIVRKWNAWLTVTLFGLIVGLISALQLFLGPAFGGQYRIGFLTLVFYAVLGVIFGAIAELIRYFHWLSHDLSDKLPKPKK